MKVASIHLTNFKRFEDLHIDLRSSSTGDVASQFLFLGDNGTGKTTVLQAVALCLSLACKRTTSVKEFNWPGWVPGRYERRGKPSIELEVHFTKDEIDATHEAARRWFDSSKERRIWKEIHQPWQIGIRAPTARRGTVFSRSVPPCALRGSPPISRPLVCGSVPGDRSERADLFVRLPGVFWFDQFRTLATPPASSEDNGDTNGAGRVSYEVGVAQFRRHLNRWQLSHLVHKPVEHDFLQELENSYKRIFPGRSFDAPEPMYRAGIPSPEDYYFMISDGNRNYDIEEMSAGEQAVFPILYEFVRQQIGNSVVLIDEIYLNLHPPVAQWLLSALPALGPGCHFLLTTHSEAISSVVSPYHIRRLPGGRLCL